MYLESNQRQIESNDEGFTAIWSDSKQLEFGTYFFNSDLTGDLFFNKLVNLNFIDEKIIAEIISLFQKNHSRPFIYLINQPELEDQLKLKGFTYFDTQYVLKKTDNFAKKSSVIKISNVNSSLWTKIFCKAYDCMEWYPTVNYIVNNSLACIDYFIDETASSCVALYEKNSILGLYCLGTLPDKQRQGRASTLIDHALNQVNSRSLDFLMLETYGRDNLLKFYHKLGFTASFSKNIYTI